MNKGLLYFHQGFSDIMNCLSLINFYAKKYDTLKVLVRQDFMSTINFYVREMKNVEVIYLDKKLLDESNPIYISQIDYTYDLLFHGYHDFYRKDIYRGAFNRNVFYVEGFYSFYGIDPKVKVDYFEVIRDYIVEERLVKKLKVEDMDYNLYHENSDNIIPNIKKEDSNFVNLDNISNNLFESISLLEKAKEIHVVDSVWASLCYLLDAKYGLLQNVKVFLYPFENRSGALVENKSRAFLCPYDLKNWKIII